MLNVCVNLSTKMVEPTHDQIETRHYSINFSHAFTRVRNGTEVVYVPNFVLCVRWANPSLRKGKRD